MLLGTLGASSLGDLLTGKGAIATSQGRGIYRGRKGKEVYGEGKGKGIVRTGYGRPSSSASQNNSNNKMDF